MWSEGVCHKQQPSVSQEAVDELVDKLWVGFCLSWAVGIPESAAENGAESLQMPRLKQCLLWELDSNYAWDISSSKV